MDIKHREILTADQIAGLKRNKMYGIFAEPGSGKTHMIKNVLIPYCNDHDYKVLYLTHRNALKHQTNTDLAIEMETLQKKFKGNFIEINNYQKIEHLYANDNHQELNTLKNYDFIVCDEFHYFVKDSYTGNTPYSARFLQEATGTKLLLTGTPQYVQPLIKQWNIKPLTKIDSSNTNIKSIRVYDKPAQISTLMKDKASSTNKFLVFQNGSSSNHNQYTKENDGAFICGASNQYRNKINHEVLNAIVMGEHGIHKGIIPHNKVIANAVIAEGVNIIDPNVKVVVSIKPKSSTDFIQQFARVRKSNIVACFVKPTNKELDDEILKLKNELDGIKSHSEHTGDTSDSYLRELFLEVRLKEMKSIRSKGFIKFIQSIYKNIKIEDYTKSKTKHQQYEHVFDKWSNIKMFTEDQKLFKDELFNAGYSDVVKRPSISVTKLRNLMIDTDSEYKLTTVKLNKEHGQRTYWLIELI